MTITITADATSSGDERIVNVKTALEGAFAALPRHPGFNPATASQAPNDPSLQSAVAAAWHP